MLRTPFGQGIGDRLGLSGMIAVLDMRPPFHSYADAARRQHVGQVSQSGNRHWREGVKLLWLVGQQRIRWPIISVFIRAMCSVV
jgi:hypothetical protein